MTRRFDATYARLQGAGLALALALLVAACAGGSGSSGFGSAVQVENEAIDAAVASRGCTAVAEYGLTVCAADGAGNGPGATPLPTPGMEGTGSVDTNLDGSGDVSCALLPAAGGCVVRVMFAPLGFPSDAEFRVAVRDREPDGRWRLAAPPDANGTSDNPSFDVEVVVDGAAVEASGPVIQMAVLVFLTPPGPLPELVTTLAATGADFAFVTTPLTPTP